MVNPEKLATLDTQTKPINTTQYILDITML
jgi:hypothetical protein